MPSHIGRILNQWLVRVLRKEMRQPLVDLLVRHGRSELVGQVEDVAEQLTDLLGLVAWADLLVVSGHMPPLPAVVGGVGCSLARSRASCSLSRARAARKHCRTASEDFP